MRFEGWYLLLGALMLGVSLLDRFVKRLPITTTIVYLAIGILLGPLGFSVAGFDPLERSDLIERLTEVAVIVSLFTAGLKLRAPFSGDRWKLPLRLASLSMVITVALITAFSVLILGLPLGVGVLLGAILAPTDPVLASDVQLEHPKDRDRLRFSLTGEAGVNDGSAFPFVMLGLGLLGLHEIGTGAWKWFAVDLVWAVTVGLGVGALLGTCVGKLVVYLRNKHEETVGRDEFISLGLIGASYGVALFLHAYGFLAVFAAGAALRRIEQKASERNADSKSGGPPLDAGNETSVTMASAVLNANEQLERILEVAVVLMLGLMISRQYLDWEALWLTIALLFIIRPLAVLVGTVGSNATILQKILIGWFGIRGIGSLYYLAFALSYKLDEQLSRTLISLVIGVMIASIFLHGLSVTPIMKFYERRKKRA